MVWPTLGSRTAKEQEQEQIPAVEEPVSLVRQDGKRPDGVTLLSWARGKPLAWDITVPDTYAESHLHDTACRPGAAADKAAANKSSKYCDLAGTHLFFPVAIETAGTWNQMAVELVISCLIFSCYRLCAGGLKNNKINDSTQTHRPQNSSNSKPHLCALCMRCGLIIILFLLCAIDS